MDDVSGKFVLVVLRADHVRVHHTIYATVGPEIWRDFAEYLATAGRKGAAESADAIWDDVRRIIDPFRGLAESCGPVDDDHVPFADYRVRRGSRLGSSVM